MFDIIELQKQLVETIGVTGHEENRATLIAKLAAPLCDDVHIDGMFNVIAHLKADSACEGKATRVMISAHQDAIGFLVTFIEENGFLRFDTLGGVNPLAAMDTLVRFENGTIGRVALIGGNGVISTKVSELSNKMLCIDVGATSAEEARKLVSVGDVAQYASDTIKAADDAIISPYLDDLIACVVQFKALEKLSAKRTPNDIYFVFSTQEEVGHRGAKAASRSINPQFGLAMDVTRTGDARGNTLFMETTIGGGAAVKVRDSAVLCTLGVIDLLKRTALENGIPYQMEVLQNGGTDTEAIQNNRSGAAAGGISITSRYTHSPSELVSIKDVEACAELLSAVLQKDLNGGIQL